MSEGSARTAPSVAYADCARHHASLRASSRMEPSKLRDAIAIRRATPETRVVREPLAKSGR